MDPLSTDIEDILGDTSALNGSTAPNSTDTGLSTPVNTSSGNTNTSGFSLGNFLTGLSGLGSNAANAYAAINGKPATATTAAAPAAATGIAAYLPWILIGGAVLVLFLLTGRKH